MNARSYKLIFFLLTACVVCILAVQAYWLHSFYRQKTEEFNRSVYDAMEEFGTRLRDRKNIESLKMTYFVQDSLKDPSRDQVVVEAEDHVQILNQDSAGFRIREVKRVKKGKGGKTIVIRNREQSASVSLGGASSKLVIKTDQLSAPAPEMHSGEIKTLLDKVMSEIIVLDTEIRDEDTIQGLVKRSLEKRGLFLPFEFSLQVKKDTSAEVLAQSKNYTAQAGDFKSDLSGDKVIPSRQLFYLQFPDSSGFVMAGMKGSMALSLLLSLVVLSVFYYVMRLIRNQKKLSEIRNDFVNNMTHELKTPIATISLALDAIGNPLIKNDEAKYTDYRRILKEENHKLNRHVERVLQMALLDKKELQLDKRPVDLREMINRALDHYKLQMAELKARVELQAPEEPMLVEADAEHLTTVISNLLDNALKYSKGIPEILIRLYRKDGRLRLHIKDKGIGIDGADQEKVFDKFYRVQGGNLHDVKGFGLGLSYVRSIVEAHGGTIALQSEKGKGAEFIMELEELSR